MTVLAALASSLAVGLVVSLIVGTGQVGGPRRRRRKAGVAGVDASPLSFWATSLGVAGVAYLASLALTGLPVVSLAPALVIATLPRAYLAKRRNKRIARVQEAWPDGIRDILASVRSGSSLANAVESLTTYGPEPLREAFQGFDVYSRSIGVVSALEMVRDDLADPTADRVIEVLVLAHQRGGAVVPDILEDLASAVTRDVWAAEQMRTEALEQKINARVVFVLPWLVLIAMTARAGPFRQFYSSPGGVLVVAIGVLLSVLGIWVVARLGSEPAEPRVFTGEMRR